MHKKVEVSFPKREVFDLLDIPVDARNIEVYAVYAEDDYVTVTYDQGFQDPEDDYKMETRLMPDVREVEMFLGSIEDNSFKVLFGKVDGSQREMTGTLHPDHKPEADPVVVVTPEGIRSFRKDSVIHMEEL